MLAKARAGGLALSAAVSLPTLARAQAYPSVPAAGRPPGQLETGGLVPPTRQATPPNEVRVVQTLDRAEREDTGRGLEFAWLQVGAGYEFLALAALSDADPVPVGVEASDAGLALAASGGLRLIFVSIGITGRVLRTADWDLWSLSGRAALHWPLGDLEPSLGLELGYARLGGFGSAVDDPGAGGFVARTEAAVDWYANPLISFGAAASAVATVLSGDAGSGSGLGVGTRLQVGLHF